jgi:hypothetical protein
VTLVNGGLVLQWNQLTLPLTHFHYDVFSAESEYDDVDEEVTFAVSPDGDVASLTLFGESFRRSVPQSNR